MDRIRRLWRLPPRDRALLFRATVLLAATRLGLWVLPLRVLRGLLVRVGRTSQPLRRGRTTPRHLIVWALSVASRFVPRATCLPRALATEALFLQSGYRAELRIGVSKTGGGRLVAHAWVESDGQIVMGNLLDLSRYAPLPPLPSVRA
jgi:hypothetical protein